MGSTSFLEMVTSSSSPQPMIVPLQMFHHTLIFFSTGKENAPNSDTSYSDTSYSDTSYSNTSYSDTSYSDGVVNIADLVQNINGDVDIVVGSVLIFCMVIGIPSNVLSCFYFMKKIKRTVHDMLYLIASAMDACILVSAFAPVTVLMSNSGRSKMMFGNRGVCVSFAVFFYFVTRFSLFMVMLMSCIRAMSIRWPFRTINRQAVLLSCVTYAFWLVVKDATFFVAKSIKATFSKGFSICVAKFTGLAGYVWLFSLATELLAVLFLIITSFILSQSALLTKKPVKRKNTGKFQAVSATITAFTATCLICNIPLFITLILEFTKVYDRLNPGTQVYLRLMSYVACTVVNAAINPCIYLCRLPVYRKWASEQTSSIRSLFALRSSRSVKGGSVRGDVTVDTTRGGEKIEDNVMK